jgi:hypothetical protein
MPTHVPMPAPAESSVSTIAPPTVATLPRALSERLFGIELDPEGLQRLLAPAFYTAEQGTRSDPFTEGARDTALRRPEQAPNAFGPAAAPQSAPAVIGDVVTFPFVVRRAAYSEPLLDFQLENVTVSAASFDHHILAAYRLAGTPGVAALCGGLALEATRRRIAADAAAQEQRRLEGDRRASDVSGTTDAMLIPLAEIVRREETTAKLDEAARRYERAAELSTAARTRHERVVAEARARFTDAAARILSGKLAKARLELEQQADRYGLKPDGVFTGDTAGLLRARLAPLTPAQRQAVRSLKDVLVLLSKTRTVLDSAQSEAALTQRITPFLEALVGWTALASPGQPPMAQSPGSPAWALQELRTSGRQTVSDAAQALASYAASRAVAAVVHPAVRFIDDPVALEGDTITDDIMAVRLAKSLHRVWISTNVVEERVLALGGIRARVYDYAAVVAETLKALDCEPTSVTAVMAREVTEGRHAARVELDEILGTGAMVLPLLAGAFTGGAGAVLTGLLLDSANVLAAAERYEAERAAFASALSAADALAEEDPSRAELTMAIAFTVMGLVL